MNESAAAPAESPSRAIWAHVAPFVGWLALMHFLDVKQLSPAMAYALRTVGCLALLLYFRPWRWYAAPSLRHVPLALGIGVLVFVLWVAGESAWAGRLPALQELYLRWCVLPFGELREPITETPYAPAVCGWPLTAMRILGSGLVIAVIEEFFWRGFLYRWLLGLDFTRVDPGAFKPMPFVVVAVVFGAEHAEWLAGVVTGLLYGWLFVRTRDIWAAALAHVVTNLLLGLYVVHSGSYQFW
jgi:CAAX prenyl protease-like protein